MADTEVEGGEVMERRRRLRKMEEQGKKKRRRGKNLNQALQVKIN